jgi:hypothetical protein
VQLDGSVLLEGQQQAIAREMPASGFLTSKEN